MKIDRQSRVSSTVFILPELTYQEVIYFISYNLLEFEMDVILAYKLFHLRDFQTIVLIPMIVTRG